MMHPGTSDGIRTAIIVFLAMIGIVFLMETIGFAQRAVQKGGGIEGFRKCDGDVHRGIIEDLSGFVF